MGLVELHSLYMDIETSTSGSRADMFRRGFFKTSLSDRKELRASSGSELYL